jgi:hypothetical protein
VSWKEGEENEDEEQAQEVPTCQVYGADEDGEEQYNAGCIDMYPAR